MSDVHQHYCRRCRAPWEHDGDRINTPAESRATHKCPRCGTEGWVKFMGHESHDQMCELETLCELGEDDRVPEHTRTQAQRDFQRLARKLHGPAVDAEWPEDVPPALQKLLDLLGV